MDETTEFKWYDGVSVWNPGRYRYREQYETSFEMSDFVTFAEVSIKQQVVDEQIARRIKQLEAQIEDRIRKATSFVTEYPAAFSNPVEPEPTPDHSEMERSPAWGMF